MTPIAVVVFGAGAAVAAVPGEDAPWQVLRDDIVRVACAEVDEQPWCRAVGLVAAPIDTIDDTLTDIEHTWSRFRKLRSAERLDVDIRHVTIDYPSVLADRDYVARYTRSVTPELRVLAWAPVEHPNAPPVPGVVRLPAFEGEWRLEPVGARTRVWHVWQADPGGSLPGWAVSLAKVRTGYEVLEDLAHAVGAELVAE